MASAPREMVVGPLDVYLAPVAEAFPLPDVSPAGNWALIGTNGDENYAEDGITVSHEQTLEEFRTLGTTGALKVARTEESLMVGFILQDLTLEEYAKAVNDVVVGTLSTPSRRWIPLRQGPDVSLFALLAKGAGLSPYGNFAIQLEIPIVYQSENPAPVFSKGAVAALAVQFSALEDPGAATAGERMGRWVIQDA